VASVGLRAFVDALPDGLGTVVGDRGLALSAGERQRVAVARVLLARPAVLVLDEPSAALDPAHERQLIDGYAAAMRGRTTIVITHRLDVVRRADRVVVLSGSKVVETGTPAALEAARGAFAALFGLPSRTR
jgi:ABC-type multidrug transport system fused ATPase/permease subunit